jgi:hypothetical protein
VTIPAESLPLIIITFISLGIILGIAIGYPWGYSRGYGKLNDRVNTLLQKYKIGRR